MRTETKKNIILFFVTYLLCWLVLEAAIRLFIVPSKHSYGRLFGGDLPPFRLTLRPSSSNLVDRSTWYHNLIIDGQKITVGDLMGVYREDPLIGYVPRENALSVNKWWQTNNVGARSRQDLVKARPHGQKRLLVFGESFAAGSRVRQEEAWASILDIESKNLNVVNLGVDGYSMGQSFLRYRQMKDKLDYDAVLLMFVPRTDLWRDINIRRDVGGNWNAYTVMPRFVIEKGELKLIKNPFSETPYRNEKRVDHELRHHLMSYDRFYSKLKYENYFLIGNSIAFKIIATALYNFQRSRLRSSLMHPGSEAMQVSKKIFKVMHKELKNDGKWFRLVILPTHHDLKLFKRDVSHRNEWDAMVASICRHEQFCIDLSTDLAEQKDAELDKGYDGTHYGPKANRIIAQLIENQVKLKLDSLH